MADILEIIKKRRSVRAFKPDTISGEIIDKLKEALIWAPSAGNLQSRKFYFVFESKIKKELAKAALGQNFISQAPLVVVGCCNENIFQHYGERGKNLYAICDVAVSIQNLMLVAENENLGTCWVGAFDEEKVSKLLNLPRNLRPIAIVPVGYPVEKPSAPLRMSKKEATQDLR